MRQYPPPLPSSKESASNSIPFAPALICIVVAQPHPIPPPLLFFCFIHFPARQLYLSNFGIIRMSLIRCRWRLGKFLCEFLGADTSYICTSLPEMAQKTFPCDKGRGDGQEESLWGRFFNLCCTYLSSHLPPIQKSLPRDTPVSPILQIRSLKVGAGGGDENGRGTGIHVRTNERETKRRQRQFLDDEGGGGGEGNFFPCPFRSPPWPSREKKEKRIEEKEENSCLKSR